ncbi:MAG: hypothetical protein ACLGIS_14035, partial [Actinomycetes bacterium]
EQVKREGGVPTGAVGLINDPHTADRVVREGRADAVLIARAALRDPHWWLRAAQELGADLPWAPQYQRAGGFDFGFPVPAGSGSGSRMVP